MKYDLSKHPYFEPWTDPASGVESFVLAERVAPLQKGLYFATPSIGAGGRWLWFSAAFPPSHRWHLAAVSLDPREPAIRHFPGAVKGGNPLLTAEGDAAYVPVEDGIYLQPVGGAAEEVLRLPADLKANRHFFGLVTDLTMSCDGKHFLLDSHIGNRWLISIAEVATGKVIPLRWFPLCHHHCTFSLHDPELFLVNQGPCHDPITGEKNDMNVRMWVMDTRLTRYEPVLGDLWFNHNSMGCHEWWTADGMIGWCDYEDGIYEVDLAERRKRLVWPRPLVHGQCDPAKRFYCGDSNPYHWNAERPCGVWFFDRRSGRDIAIATSLPQPPFAPGERRSWHPDPHPHFAADGSCVIYTTSARGTLDVAVAPVERILARLG